MLELQSDEATGFIQGKEGLPKLTTPVDWGKPMCQPHHLSISPESVMEGYNSGRKWENTDNWVSHTQRIYSPILVYAEKIGARTRRITITRRRHEFHIITAVNFKITVVWDVYHAQVDRASPSNFNAHLITPLSRAPAYTSPNGVVILT